MGRGTVDDEQDDPDGGRHGLDTDSEVTQPSHLQNYIQHCKRLTNYFKKTFKFYENNDLFFYEFVAFFGYEYFFF